MARVRTSPFVLLFAGSDPSGGAGLELDLKVHALFGVHAAAIATCQTVQTATRVHSVAPRPVRDANRQIAALARSASFRVVQVGMVADRAWIERLARLAAQDREVPWIVDPVFAPTSGPRALPTRALDLYRRRLVPRAMLLTPNAVEAAELLGVELARVRRDPESAATELLALGPAAVLLKGGHLAARGPVVDRLRGRFGARDFVQRRQAGVAPRGTGCALASAIAASLARGRALVSAIERAERWLTVARSQARPIGAGRPYLGLPRP